MSLKLFLRHYFVFSGSEKKIIKLAFPNCICKKNQFFEFQGFHLNLLQILKNTVAIHCPKKIIFLF